MKSAKSQVSVNGDSLSAESVSLIVTDLLPQFAMLLIHVPLNKYA
jgi:hypothetical protein